MRKWTHPADHRQLIAMDEVWSTTDDGKKDELITELRRTAIYINDFNKQ